MAATASFRLSLSALALGALTVAVPMRSAAADALLDRGNYLMHGIVACGDCHTPKGPSGKDLPNMELAGGREFDAASGAFKSFAPNITPDKETGIGNWTDAQIIDAIRNGKRPDGTTIGPPMPVAFFRAMSDSDVKAIVAYLHTVKPVHNEVDKSTFAHPLPASYGPAVTSVPDVPTTNLPVYGKYLATALGHCMDCHTPLGAGGVNDMSRMGAGGNIYEAPYGGEVMSANLTPGNPTGVASWTNDQIKTAITKGVRPDGRPIVPLMPFDNYKNIDNQDLNALVAFLRTLKPVKGP